ncbi:MAG: NYN domain-containing protein, partial [Eggerthellaceae bacterium]|nr:NYN domain-containing protein [Eggerthellaceae bacterium]
MEQKSSDKRFALLIDADNVSARYIKPILNELSKYGTVTVKRIYGDWTLTLHAKWKDALLENSITPIQQFGYTQGKNATDSAMIIDAMDILYTDSVDGFCIVSSDSDFTRLASRLRESGRMVIGMGEKKTPTPFRRACDVFTTLELLVEKRRDAGGNGAPAMSKDEVEQAVVDIITDNQNNGKATGLGEVGSRMLKRYPDFDVRSYGTNLLSKLLSEFTRVRIIKDHSSVTVELAEGAEKSSEKKEHAEKSSEKSEKGE